MKKIVFVLIALFLTLSLVSPALAAPGNKVAKGEVTSINADGTITILTLRQQSIIVVPPAGYDLASLQIGDIVLVKGRYDSEGRLAAEWLKIPDDGWGEDANEQDDDDGGKPENPGKGNDKDKNKDKDKSDDEADDDDEKAFCESGGIHPVAARLAERYGVTTDWVMSYYCNGYGMGQIMLALKTSSLTDADPESLLAETAEGTGWGEIWQAMKLIGKDRDAKSPPGQLKKLNP
jgi:hypothetical protein